MMQTAKMELPHRLVDPDHDGFEIILVLLVAVVFFFILAYIYRKRGLKARKELPMVKKQTIVDTLFGDEPDPWLDQSKRR